MGGHDHGDTHARAAAQRRAARGRAGHAARALLRPRLRARDHAVHRADVRPADLGRAGPGPAGAGRPLVGVGRLRVADERRRSRGGRGPHRDVRRDGGAPGRLALRARAPSATRALLFACAYAAVRVAHIALFMLASRDDPALRSSVLGARRQHGVAVALLVGASFADGRRAGGPLAARPRCSTWAGPTSSAPRAGARPGPLRRATRADRHHRARRVDRRDRRRRRRAPRRGHRRRGGAGHRRWPPRSGGSTSTSSRSSPSGGSPGPRRARSRTSSRATRTPTCTCRWSPASCCSRSG